MHVARVVVHAVVGPTLGLMARVVVIVFVVEFPQPFFCIWRYTLYINVECSCWTSHCLVVLCVFSSAS